MKIKRSAEVIVSIPQLSQPGLSSVGGSSLSDDGATVEADMTLKDGIWACKTEPRSDSLA